MYHKKANHWDTKLLLTGLVLGGLIIVLSSWVEAATEHTVDYHAEIPQQDWQNQNDAQEESKDNGAQTYTDKDGNTHIYENGNEHC